MGADEARAVVALRRPELAATWVEPLDAGYDNAAFLVGGAWVARFPRRASAVARLTTETLVMPGLAPRLPLPVPVPGSVHAATPAVGYPWPFALHRWLPGSTADLGALERIAEPVSPRVPARRAT